MLQSVDPALVISLVSLTVALVALWLGIRRDRREVKSDVAITATTDGSDLVVTFTNVGHRPLSIARAGFNSTPAQRPVFEGWRPRPRSGRVSGGLITTDPVLPSPALKPGEPAYIVRGPMHVVKSATYPAGPISVWCEDERGTLYERGLSVAVRQAVWATKRRVAGPIDDHGQPTEVEIEDDEARPVPRVDAR